MNHAERENEVAEVEDLFQEIMSNVRSPMAPFEELQALWQQQPVRAVTAPEAAELTSALRRYGRRRRFRREAQPLIDRLSAILETMEGSRA